MTGMTRDEMCAARCTLNGHRAKVNGTRLPFAQVVRLDGPFKGASFEWSWGAVERILTHRNGEFHS